MQCRNPEPIPVNPIDLLPPITQTGENTFGCLVNGQEWVTKTTIDVAGFYQRGVLQINGSLNETGRKQTITLIIIDSTLAEKSYILTKSPLLTAKFADVTSLINTNWCFYEEENLISGTLNIIHLDEQSRIISGLFEFTTHMDGCDTIRVTDGRFDLTYAN